MFALYRARSAKVEAGFAGTNAFVCPEIALQSFERAHDLFAKPLTLRRIMRYGTASIQSYKVFARFLQQNARNRASCPSVNSERGLLMSVG